jgi:aminoglycoside phosphotransferase
VLDVLLPPPLLAEQHPLRWLQPVDVMVVHVAEVAAVQQKCISRHQPAGCSGALFAARCQSRDAVNSERQHLRMLKILQQMLCKAASPAAARPSSSARADHI